MFRPIDDVEGLRVMAKGVGLRVVLTRMTGQIRIKDARWDEI